MADNFGSDMVVGFKRRISELSVMEGKGITVEEPRSNPLSPQQQSLEVVSDAKNESDTVWNGSDCNSESFNCLEKKATCSSLDASATDIVAQEKQEIEEDKLGSRNDVIMKLNDEIVLVAGLSSYVAQEMLPSEFVNESKKDLAKYGVCFCGIEQLGEVRKSLSPRLFGDLPAIEIAEKLSVKKVHIDSAVEDCNIDLAGSCIAFGENESQSLLENKERRILFEHGLESLSYAETHVVKFTDTESSREILGDTIKEVFEPSSKIDENLGAMEVKYTDEKSSDCEEMPEILHNDGLKGDFVDPRCALKIEVIDNGGLAGESGDPMCALKIEVIDDTALIDTGSASRLGNGCGKKRRFVGIANYPQRNGKKNTKQETDGKRSWRREKGWKKTSGTNGNEKIFTYIVEAQNGCEKKSDGSKRFYSRKQMEALRLVNIEEQRKKWIEVYCGLGPAVAREYDGLADCNHQKHIRLNFDPRQHFRKKEATPAIMGEECYETMDNEIQNMNPPARGLSVSEVDGCCTVVEEEWSEDDDSDAEYSSIYRPAFYVTGEPDFDSGPPQDGLEYLRRVRWEAEQIPKVKVAKVERSKLNKEQTIYMPMIPDIVKCPEHLIPLQQWEDEFLADFSELRLALSLHGKLQSVPNVHEVECSHQLCDSIIILEDLDYVTTDGVDSCQSIDCSVQSFSGTADENDAHAPLSLSSPKSSVNGGYGDCPTLSMILGMDSVARVSMLKKHINLAESMSFLSRNDCAWLFALCAAVDTPLDADTCASLRCLLRKCASLRVGKTDLDDEVVRLNILATISGKYFGQSEN